MTLQMKRNIRKTFLYVIYILLSFIFIFPLVYMIVSSFKSDAQIVMDMSSISAFIPKGELSIQNCNGVQREHNKKLNNGLPILHKVPPKRDYGRYFCIMAEKGGTSHGGLTEKLSPFFHAKKQEVNAYGR